VVYTVPFALVASAKLILTDRLIAASRPIDSSGADEEELSLVDDIVEEQED